MGFKPRPDAPPPPPRSTPGKKGFVEKTSKVASPGFLTRKSVLTPKKPDSIKKSNSWWNLDDAEEERPKSARSLRSSKSSIPASPASRRSSLGASASISSTTTPRTPRNSTKKTVFRHKVFQKGVLLYEWEQNPKFVSIYYPTPNADFKAFCNIFDALVQLGTKPKGLPTKWFLSHDTGGPVDVEESSWKQFKQHCKIILAKENKGSTWSRALKDDRVDDIQTTQKARPQVDRSQSQPIMSPSRSASSSPSSMKHKVMQRRRSNDDSDDVDDNDDDDDDELDKLEERRRRRMSLRSRRSNDSDDVDEDLGERKTREGTRRSGNNANNRALRASGGSAPRERATSRRSSGSDPRERTANRRSSSHDGFEMSEQQQPSKPRRKSLKKNAAPRRTRSNCSLDIDEEKPVPVVFVDPNSNDEAQQQQQNLTRKKSSRRRSKMSAASRSRSCDSIDEEEQFYPQNIEVDMNSDLVSVLGP